MPGSTTRIIDAPRALQRYEMTTKQATSRNATPEEARPIQRPVAPPHVARHFPKKNPCQTTIGRGVTLIDPLPQRSSTHSPRGWLFELGQGRRTYEGIQTPRTWGTFSAPSESSHNERVAEKEASHIHWKNLGSSKGPVCLV